jgi:hypothetical protein
MPNFKDKIIIEYSKDLNQFTATWDYVPIIQGQGTTPTDALNDLLKIFDLQQIFFPYYEQV